MRGWWKLASPFLRLEGTGLNFDLSSFVRICWMDSMSANAASVIGRGSPFLCHLRWCSDCMGHGVWDMGVWDMGVWEWEYWYMRVWM